MQVLLAPQDRRRLRRAMGRRVKTATPKRVVNVKVPSPRGKGPA